MPIYMNWDSKKIKGDVTAEGHKDEIELNSFQWGVGRGISSPTGASANRESSAPSVSEVTVTKALDKASSDLLKEALQGEGVTVVLNFTTTDKGKLETYLTVTLTNTMISGYSTSSGGDKPSESLSLNFTKFEYKAVPKKGTNEADSPKSFTYDMALAKVV